ncbi:MAG: hypothetical protein ABR585_07295 [Gemmatimonadaceae bacterium]
MSADIWGIDRADLGPGVAAMLYTNTGEIPVIVVAPDADSTAVETIKTARRRR